jgi:hypothetical protein
VEHGAWYIIVHIQFLSISEPTNIHKYLLCDKFIFTKEKTSMKHHCCIVIILRWVLCRAWNGIVLDNDAAGGDTQLILPNDVNHTVGNVNFGLPHYTRAVVIRHPDGNAYFTGGYNDSGYSAAVTKLNPVTNTSSLAASMNTPRSKHAATVVNNTIIVCGGEIYCDIVQKL